MAYGIDPPDWMGGNTFDEQVQEYAGITARYSYGGGVRAPRGNANAIYRLPEIRVIGRPSYWGSWALDPPATGPAPRATYPRHRYNHPYHDPWARPTVSPAGGREPRDPASPPPPAPPDKRNPGGGKRRGPSKGPLERQSQVEAIYVFHQGRKISWP